MKKQDVFLFNECFVLSGFILCLNGHEIAGTLVGAASIVYAFMALNVHVLKNDWMQIGTISFVQLLLLEISHLNAEIPSIYFLSFASLIVAYAWNHAGFKAIHYGMKWMNAAGIFFLIAAMIMPYRTYSLLQTFLIVLFIFYPAAILYFKRQIHYFTKLSHRQKNIAVVK